MIKIDKKIVEYTVVKPEDNATTTETPPIHQVKKLRQRPVYLPGGTYRLRTHVYKHAFYVTINNLGGTPFEIFINTTNEDAAMWIVSQTLSWSAIFREVSDLTFLIRGMLKVVDPRGAHHAHERLHKSIVAEIGYILDCEIKGVALKKTERQPLQVPPEVDTAPAVGNRCPECGQLTFVKRDGCDKCLNEECEYSICE
jgi:hypothetical protein